MRYTDTFVYIFKYFYSKNSFVIFYVNYGLWLAYRIIILKINVSDINLDESNF